MESEPKYNPDIFEEDACWEQRVSEHELRRLNTIVDAVPEGVVSIIDVGCGDGKLTRLLRQAGYEVMAVDRSATALKRVPEPKLCISGEQLPFEDDSFDLAVCSEVLEHLPEPLLSNVTAELQRVARSTIIVTVPFEEDIHHFQVTCAQCAHRFNPYGHLHSFNRHDLAALMSLPSTITHIEKPQPYYHPTLKHFAFGILKRSVFVHHCVCPNCKTTDFSHLKTDYIRKMIGGLNRILTRGRTIQAGWLMAIYSKVEAA